MSIEPVYRRAWFGLTGLVVLAGLALQLWDTSRLTSGHFATPLTRTLNVFCFFTIESNILLAVPPVRPEPLDRLPGSTSTDDPFLRLAAGWLVGHPANASGEAPGGWGTGTRSVQEGRRTAETCIQWDWSTRIPARGLAASTTVHFPPITPRKICTCPGCHRMSPG